MSGGSTARALTQCEHGASMRPQTNGMVERFNGRIEDILQSHRFRSGEALDQTILRYVRLYNGQFPQSVLKGRTPIDALKEWHRDKPELFRKRPCNHTGCDSYAYLERNQIARARRHFREAHRISPGADSRLALQRAR